MTARHCETCDFHGPELPTLEAASRDLHRALHNIWRAIEARLEPVVARLARWLA